MMKTEQRMSKQRKIKVLEIGLARLNEIIESGQKFKDVMIGDDCPVCAQMYVFITNGFECIEKCPAFILCLAHSNKIDWFWPHIQNFLDFMKSQRTVIIKELRKLK